MKAHIKKSLCIFIAFMAMGCSKLNLCDPLGLACAKPHENPEEYNYVHKHTMKNAVAMKKFKSCAEFKSYIDSKQGKGKSHGSY